MGWPRQNNSVVNYFIKKPFHSSSVMGSDTFDWQVEDNFIFIKGVTKGNKSICGAFVVYVIVFAIVLNWVGISHLFRCSTQLVGLVNTRSCALMSFFSLNTLFWSRLSGLLQGIQRASKHIPPKNDKTKRFNTEEIYSLFSEAFN